MNRRPIVLLAALGLLVLPAGPSAAGPASAAVSHAVAPGSSGSSGSSASAVSAVSAVYSAPLRTAVADLPVAAEVRTGYAREGFRHWIDADGNGCDTREEVLIDEATSPPSVGSGCSLGGGRWYSYYDGGSTTSSSDFDVDHVVPLAEAWDSGARSWAAGTRERFANDLGDGRALVAVTASSNRAKSDGDIADWLPARDRCRYLVDVVAVKHRWRLAVDSRERDAMVSLAGSCSNVAVSVTHAR